MRKALDPVFGDAATSGTTNTSRPAARTASATARAVRAARPINPSVLTQIPAAARQAQFLFESARMKSTSHDFGNIRIFVARRAGGDRPGCRPDHKKLERNVARMALMVSARQAALL